MTFSAIAHWPHWAPYSAFRSTAQISLPLRAWKAPSRPVEFRWYTTPSQYVGTERAPGYSPFQGRPLSACQTILPSASSARTLWRSLKSPEVNRSPSAMVTVENPPPHCPAVQRSLGPPAGHCFRSPLSVEMLSRLGPWNWGQEPTAAAWLAGWLAGAARAACAPHRAATATRTIHRRGGSSLRC